MFETNINILTWIQGWYLSQCDGVWEHDYGIKISNCDNPGWMVVIDLKDTEWENIYEIPYSVVENPENENDWYGFSINNNVFDGAGDPSKLELLLNIFKNIIENPPVLLRV